MREVCIMTEDDDMAQNPLLSTVDVCCYKVYWAADCIKLPVGLYLLFLENSYGVLPYEEETQERSMFSWETIV